MKVFLTGGTGFIGQPLAPLQRLAGLPAFLSAETISASSASYNFSSAKAQRELGWTYRPGRQMWLDIIDKEIELLGKRGNRSLVSRVKPLEMRE